MRKFSVENDEPQTTLLPMIPHTTRTPVQQQFSGNENFPLSLFFIFISHIKNLICAVGMKNITFSPLLLFFSSRWKNDSES
jgi:hypothetical protein